MVDVGPRPGESSKGHCAVNHPTSLSTWVGGLHLNPARIHDGHPERNARRCAASHLGLLAGPLAAQRTTYATCRKTNEFRGRSSASRGVIPVAVGRPSMTETRLSPNRRKVPARTAPFFHPELS